MNDDELITVVREQRAKVPMDTPVEQIISRGRVVRARRRIPRLVAALAVVAGAALTVTTLAPADHQPGAWAVARQPDGTISVAISEMSDAAGLQRALRADGVPVSVTFSGQPGLSCPAQPAHGQPRDH